MVASLVTMCYNVIMNANYFRSLVAEEICETVMWGGLSDDFHTMKTKGVDKKGKTFYRIEMNCGEIIIYSPKLIFVNDHKCTSVDNCKKHLQFNYIM